MCDSIIKELAGYLLVGDERRAWKLISENLAPKDHVYMYENLLRKQGWDTRYLGANLPIKDAVIYANKWRSDVVGISLSIVYHLPSLIVYLQDLNQLDYDPEIIIGGRITSLYRIESYCLRDVRIFNDLYSLQTILEENKLCKALNVTS